MVKAIMLPIIFCLIDYLYYEEIFLLVRLDVDQCLDEKNSHISVCLICLQPLFLMILNVFIYCVTLRRRTFCMVNSICRYMDDMIFEMRLIRLPFVLLLSFLFEERKERRVFNIVYRLNID